MKLKDMAFLIGLTATWCDITIYGGWFLIVATGLQCNGGVLAFRLMKQYPDWASSILPTQEVAKSIEFTFAWRTTATRVQKLRKLNGWY